MIKSIQSDEIFNTPFISNKSWTLNATSSIQTVEEGYFVSSSYVFYDSASAAKYGYVAAPQNSNGTYKRLVYQLVKNAYYNDNVAQSLGLETTDPDKVFKVLQDTCVRITLPRVYFGEAIFRDSVIIYDYSKDKNYTLYDDTYGNLYVDGTHFINYTDVTSRVYSAPSVNFFASPTSGFAPLTTVLSPSVTGNATEYFWDLGDGTTSTSSLAFSHVYDEIGIYTVSLKVTGIGGSTTVTRNNYITASVLVPPPTVDFTGTPLSGYILPPATSLSITFTSLTTNASSYLWDFGDGTTSTSQNPTKTYSSVGIYDVTLTAIGVGGTASTTKSAYISVVPVPKVTVSFNIDKSSGYASIDLFTFKNLTTAATTALLNSVTNYEWDFGDGTILNVPTKADVTHTYTIAGTYDVTLTATNPGGDAVLTKMAAITILPVTVPIANFTTDKSSGDINLDITFTNTSTGVGSLTYQWDLDDGSGLQTSSNPAPNPYQYTVKGTYDVQLTVSNIAGSDSITKTIVAYDPADRLNYTPTSNLMDWSSDSNPFASYTNPNVTLANFKTIIDPTPVKLIRVSSTTNPITFIEKTNYYTSLYGLELVNQNLSSGISSIGLPNLKYLNLDNNTNLASVNISDLTNIEVVNISNNPLLTSLDLSSKTNLKRISSVNNALTSINITGNTSLTELYAYSNSGLTSVTGLTTCTALNVFQVWNCNLNGALVNFSSCPYLITIQVSGNASLGTIDVTSNTLLRELFCQDDGISTINLTNNTQLKVLAINGNSLSSLNLTNNTQLTRLLIYANTSLGIPTGLTTLTDLIEFNAYDCNFTTALNLTTLTKLETLYCGNTALPSINLSTCTKLKTLSVRNSPSVTALNLPATLNDLKRVEIDNNGLTATEINNLLIKLDTNGLSGGYFKSSGGTNAAPTGAGITAKNNLIAKGWSVTTN